MFSHLAINETELPDLTVEEVKNLIPNKLELSINDIPLLMFPDSDIEFRTGSFLLRIYRSELYESIFKSTDNGQFIEFILAIKAWYVNYKDSVTNAFLLKEEPSYPKYDIVNLVDLTKLKLETEIKDEMYIKMYLVIKSINQYYVEEIIGKYFGPDTTPEKKKCGFKYLLEMCKFLLNNKQTKT